MDNEKAKQSFRNLIDAGGFDNAVSVARAELQRIGIEERDWINLLLEAESAQFIANH